MNNNITVLNNSLDIEKEIDFNNILCSNGINKYDEDQNFNSDFYYLNDDESCNFGEFLIEEKIKSSKFNNRDLLSFNDHISLDENQNDNNNFLGKKHYLNNDDKITFKKNRNNLFNNYNNNIFKTLNEKMNINNNNLTSETSSSNHINKINYSNFRSDSLLIKFKSFLGKSFINYINNKLKNLTKRRIKFFSFNYKKFTLNVSYTENKKWLNEKIKNLMLLGGETNQTKNEKALKSLYRRKEEEFNEVKNILELTYKDIIEKFYTSKYFEEFKNDKKIILLNNNFLKIMNVSLLVPNGFIIFLNTRKGNKEKTNENYNDEI